MKYILIMFIPFSFSTHAFDEKAEMKKIQEHRNEISEKMCVVDRADRKFYHQNQILKLKKILASGGLDSNSMEETQKNIVLHQEKVKEFSGPGNCKIASQD